jgi:PKD repeat protein
VQPASTGSVTGRAQTLSFLDPTVNAVEGRTLSGVIGTFFNPGSTAPASAYAATVHWGDGASSAATVGGTGAAAGFQISGTHLYHQAGRYNVQINLTGPGGQSLLINHTTAVVAEAPLTGHAVTYGAKPGTYNNDVVGYFSDPNTLSQAKDFSATVAWGDGSTSAGLVNGGNGLFTVTGRHTYVRTGTYSVNVTVRDTGGGTASWTSTLYVGTRPAGTGLLGSDPPIEPVEGVAVPVNMVVATFTDGDGNTDPTRYTATIQWGDGHVTSSNPVVYDNNAAQFEVQAGNNGNTYAEEGGKVIQVQITDNADGNTDNITCPCVVDDAPLHGVPATPGPATAGTAWTGSLLTLTDRDPGGAATDYTATVAWGDGQTSAGTVSGSGPFTVGGTHIYAQGGSYNIVVTTDDGGGATTVQGIGPISVSGLNGKGQNLTVAAGALVMVPVATFTDSDGNTNPNNYTATINWGDGNPTVPGLVSYDMTNHVFDVMASSTNP